MFFTIGTVESFNICVLVRLSWLNILDEHPVSFSSGNKVTAQELGAVVGS